jgi:hypothetical protein
MKTMNTISNKPFQLLTLTAPSAWASYLINGDVSGLEENEVTAIHAWLTAEGLGYCVDCNDAGFLAYHDASSFALAGDCQTYTFIN